MKLDRFAPTLCCLALLLLGACSTPLQDTPHPPSLAAKLDTAWIASAKRLQGGERTIYYRGRASPEPRSSARHWSGTIEGEVLVLTSSMAIVLPSGTFTLRPDGAVGIFGPHNSVITENPVFWKHLLVP